MKIYNRYVVTVAALLLSTTVFLIATGQNSLLVYYTFYVIEALIVTELYIHLNTKARHGLNLVSIMLFLGFIFALSLQVIRLIT